MLHQSHDDQRRCRLIVKATIRPLSLGKLVVMALLVFCGSAAVTAAVLDAPIVLRNTSTSSPLGLYRYVGSLPRPGDYMAFHADGPGFELITQATGLRLPAIPILKPIAAFPGDHVCFDPLSETYQVNGGEPITIEERHWQGRLLPIWKGCRHLTATEHFVYSDRIPNSLDSRFYGPVERLVVVGAYQPLWIDRNDPKANQSEGQGQ